VLDTGLFDFEAASEAPGWLAEMRGEHVPETEEYGISSFAYQSRRPFHPQRFWDLIHSEWAGVVRSKGYFWLASRPEFAGSWSQAGGACRHGAAGYWWDAVPSEHWPEDPDYRANIAAKSTGEWGDRRQELVFIGMEMDKAEVCANLDACLLTDAEMALGRSGWVNFPDPFPVWGETAPDEIETELA
jgi:G3E family GTPase